MKLKALVVIPGSILWPAYSFSAPVAWLFSKHREIVRGVYGFELNGDIIRKFDLFIVELNWFGELEEFGLVVNYIKKVNKKAKILIGGLYALLKYEEIFRNYDVDYIIKGDNELPMQLFLDSHDPKTIPNFVGRDFENPIGYVFKEEDYDSIEYNLDWFPTFKKFSSVIWPFALPMIITVKSGCAASHAGCEYCLGSKN